MIYLPMDLFTPYIKGRENAIDRNWNDLNQSNQVEQGWLNNDARQLNNWFAQDTYDDRLASSNAKGRIDQNSATGSDLNTQIAVAGQPGALAQAQTASDYQTALRSASQPYITPMANNNALFSYGQSVDRAAQGNAAIATAPQIRTATANNTLAAANLQGNVIKNNAELLPLQQEVQRGNLTLQPLQQDVQRSNLQLQQTVNDELQKNPQMLFAQQPTVATNATPDTQLSNTDSQVYSLAAQLPPGRVMQLNIGGAAVNAGRDNNGVFVVENGQKRYVSPTNAATTTDTTFSFGGLK